MYKIVCAEEKYRFEAIEKVEEEVNELKSQGWTVTGNVSVVQTPCYYYCVSQAMIK